jgi:hypothetical protein
MNTYWSRGMLRGAGVFGSCSALALLTALGCGEVSNLGTNPEPSGGDSSGDPIGGGGLGNADAGTSAAGGHGGKQAGGAPANGGQGGMAHGGDGQGGDGQGGDGVDTGPLPYPLNPTVPISADCRCADTTLTCNAGGQCVPRCEPGGVCAVWRVERSVAMLGTGDDTVYYTVSGERDELGNVLPGQAGRESLWRAHYPDLAPTKVAVLGDGQHQISARIGDKTFLLTNHDTVLAVDDSGSVVERELPDDVSMGLVTSEGVFTLAMDGSIARLALGADGSFGSAFEALVPAAEDDPDVYSSLILVTDRLWRAYGPKICSFDLADLQAAPHCLPNAFYSHLYGATGSRIVARHDRGWVYELDVDNQTTRLLWMSDDLLGFTGTMAGGFVTGWAAAHSDIGSSVLGRFPTEAPAKKVTPLIAQAVVRAMSENGADGGVSLVPPAVTTEAVYWTQWIYDDRGPGTSRYIFRAPLPQ